MKLALKWCFGIAVGIMLYQFKELAWEPSGRATVVMILSIIVAFLCMMLLRMLRTIESIEKKIGPF
jgi:membrane protein YdbS with pleckstrin-like domain